MTYASLPVPNTQPPARWQRDAGTLRRDPGRRVDGEVRVDAGADAITVRR